MNQGIKIPRDYDIEREDTMSEKMLVTQALDERDLLIKKIRNKIDSARFVDYQKRNENRVAVQKISKEEFTLQVESAYQQIQDLITRFQKIDEAIVASNANTKITTSYGTFTVAGAISLRNRLRGTGVYKEEADFEGRLLKRMESTYQFSVKLLENENKKIEETAENMRLSILGKDTKNKDEKPLEVVDAYVRENTYELLNPLNVQEKVKELCEKRETLISELDTQIKVSNATTIIEI